MKLKDALKPWTERNRLTALANRYGTDKGTRRWHRSTGYTRIYEPLFRSLRDKPIRLLEIGLLAWSGRRYWQNMGARNDGGAVGSRAPSLEMWLAYFSRAEVIGFDINNFSAVDLPRCTIIRGDMSSREDLSKIAALGPFDVIIDDASHASHHQQIALAFLFAHVAPGGLYIIEDLTEQPPGLELADAPKTRDVLRRLQVTGEFISPFASAQERALIEASLASVAMYDALDPGPGQRLDATDALAVIRKR